MSRSRTPHVGSSDIMGPSDTFLPGPPGGLRDRPPVSLTSVPEWNWNEGTTTEQNSRSNLPGVDPGRQEGSGTRGRGSDGQCGRRRSVMEIDRGPGTSTTRETALMHGVRGKCHRVKTSDTVQTRRHVESTHPSFQTRLQFEPMRPVRVVVGNPDQFCWSLLLPRLCVCLCSSLLL